MTDHRNIEPWGGLPSGARRALLQARAALVGPVADGQSRRCAVATIDQTLADDAQAREIEALRADAFALRALVAAGHVSQVLVDRARTLPGAPIAEIPQIKRGLVWCTVCDAMQRVDGGKAMDRGWPKCCGYTMTLDSPEEREALRRPEAGAS